MKNIKRILSLLLTLIMLAALCLPVLADGSKDYYPYKYYMCVGDSIAAGCALTKDGSETYFDNETDDYTTVYNPDYISITAMTTRSFRRHITALWLTNLTRSCCSVPEAG